MRDASPISLLLFRGDYEVALIEQKHAEGCSFAAIKIERRLAADSPKYDDIRVSKRTFISGRPISGQSLRPSDFPQPGGP